jgi:hypothetical protein
MVMARFFKGFFTKTQSVWMALDRPGAAIMGICLKCKSIIDAMPRPELMLSG